MTAIDSNISRHIRYHSVYICVYWHYLHVCTYVPLVYFYFSGIILWLPVTTTVIICFHDCRWCLFRRPIIADPSRVVIYSKAAIALHNYLRTEESSVYYPPGFVDGEDGSGNVIDGAWRKKEVPVTGLESLRHVGGNRYNNLCTSLVDKLYSWTLFL